jgi:nucleotide-binding universal stress UspA family protein
MNKQMKIMIAYDGSGYADTAIDDLRLAGLPEKGEAVVISIADVSKTSIATSCEIGVLGRFVSSALLEETIALTHREKANARNKAINLAIRGGKRVLSNLPGWRVRNQIGVGNPAEELLKKADEFNPDLIVVGSHGRSAIGRFFLGSVSQEVAEKTNCSVRVVRQSLKEEPNQPNKVIIGASSLPDAEEVTRAVRTRRWTEETEIRLVVADDGISAGRVSAVYPYAKAIFEQSIEELGATGAKVSVDIKSGVTETILLTEAANWKADSIFVANERESEEKGLGSLAANLITSAKCTVELVR